MSYDTRKEYLDAKYAKYDDESDAPYRRKKKHDKPKKSNHKHEYANTVLTHADKPDSFMLVSVCRQCGKINSVMTDKRIERKFPHIRYKNTLIGFPTEYKEEYDEFVEWCKDNYETIEMDYDCDWWELKYI